MDQEDEWFNLLQDLDVPSTFNCDGCTQLDEALKSAELKLQLAESRIKSAEGKAKAAEDEKVNIEKQTSVLTQFVLSRTEVLSKNYIELQKKYKAIEQYKSAYEQLTKSYKHVARRQLAYTLRVQYLVKLCIGLDKEYRTASNKLRETSAQKEEIQTQYNGQYQLVKQLMSLSKENTEKIKTYEDKIQEQSDTIKNLKKMNKSSIRESNRQFREVLRLINEPNVLESLTRKQRKFVSAVEEGIKNDVFIKFEAPFERADIIKEIIKPDKEFIDVKPAITFDLCPSDSDDDDEVDVLKILHQAQNSWMSQSKSAVTPLSPDTKREDNSLMEIAQGLLKLQDLTYPSTSSNNNDIIDQGKMKDDAKRVEVDQFVRDQNEICRVKPYVEDQEIGYHYAEEDQGLSSEYNSTMTSEYDSTMTSEYHSTMTWKHNSTMTSEIIVLKDTPLIDISEDHVNVKSSDSLQAIVIIPDDDEVEIVNDTQTLNKDAKVKSPKKHTEDILFPHLLEEVAKNNNRMQLETNLSEDVIRSVVTEHARVDKTVGSFMNKIQKQVKDSSVTHPVFVDLTEDKEDTEIAVLPTVSMSSSKINKNTASSKELQKTDSFLTPSVFVDLTVEDSYNKLSDCTKPPSVNKESCSSSPLCYKDDELAIVHEVRSSSVDMHDAGAVTTVSKSDTGLNKSTLKDAVFIPPNDDANLSEVSSCSSDMMNVDDVIQCKRKISVQESENVKNKCLKFCDPPSATKEGCPENYLQEMKREDKKMDNDQFTNGFDNLWEERSETCNIDLKSLTAVKATSYDKPISSEDMSASSNTSKRRQSRAMRISGKETSLGTEHACDDSLQLKKYNTRKKSSSYDSKCNTENANMSNSYITLRRNNKRSLVQDNLSLNTELCEIHAKKQNKIVNSKSNNLYAETENESKRNSKKQNQEMFNLDTDSKKEMEQVQEKSNTEEKSNTDFNVILKIHKLHIAPNELGHSQTPNAVDTNKVIKATDSANFGSLTSDNSKSGAVKEQSEILNSCAEGKVFDVSERDSKLSNSLPMSKLSDQSCDSEFIDSVIPKRKRVAHTRKTMTDVQTENIRIDFHALDTPLRSTRVTKTPTKNKKESKIKNLKKRLLKSRPQFYLSKKEFENKLETDKNVKYIKSKRGNKNSSKNSVLENKVSKNMKTTSPDMKSCYSKMEQNALTSPEVKNEVPAVAVTPLKTKDGISIGSLSPIEPCSDVIRKLRYMESATCSTPVNFHNNNTFITESKQSALDCKSQNVTLSTPQRINAAFKKYAQLKQVEIMEKKRRSSTKETEEHNFSIALKILRSASSLRAFEPLVNEIRSIHPEMLAGCTIQELENFVNMKDEEITRCVGNLVTFTYGLESGYEKYRDYVSLVLKCVQYRIFNLNNTPPRRNLMILARFYVMCCLRGNLMDHITVLAVDALCCLSYSTHLVVKEILSLYPGFLPMANVGKEDPFFLVLSHSILSQQENYKSWPEVKSLKNILCSKYLYKRGEFMGQDVANILLNMLKAGTGDKLLESSLNALAKRHPRHWTYRTLMVNGFIPLLEKWKLQFQDDSRGVVEVTDSMVITAIHVLGYITRGFDQSLAEKETNHIIDVLVELTKLDKVSEEVEDALLDSLVCLSYVNFPKVCDAILNWKKRFDFKDSLLKQLFTQRHFKWWKATFSSLSSLSIE